jgi:flagellar biosynthetic protein FliQ
MLKQTRTRDLEYFLALGGFGPTAVNDLPMRVVIPAFVISELQTAFQMGFLSSCRSSSSTSWSPRTDGARHDDDAAGHRRAAAQAAALRPRGRLAPGGALARPKFRHMNPDLAIDLFKSTVTFALYVVAPFLGLTLVVGLLASVVQSVTSMHEQTLTFVPKLIALAGLVMVLTPWLLRTLSEFAVSTLTRMGTLGQ